MQTIAEREEGCIMGSEPFDDTGQNGFADQDFNESIDIALATIQMSQVEFSHMADSKANIMITVSSILLTLAVAKIEQGTLLIPSIAVAAACVPALVFAILCVMPSAAVRAEPIKNNEKLSHFNPLFFMHFTRLPIDRFEREIERVVRDPQELYQHLSQDIYYAGLVLRLKKFRYLRWSYLSLLFGVGGSCLALLYELL
ncbi:MAG: hypothetical protein GWP58_13525 [Gammaproteobacteria bacterium]|jgi:hypothetical protein|nr:hypothetical protein [Gammaproteobacteria bacterium]